MPGTTTPGGWPYVLPADHPLEYPALSQQLAEKLEANDSPQLGTLTPAAGWKLSTTYATMVAKVNGLLYVTVCLERTSDLTIATGTFYTIANLPAGFIPASGKAGAAVGTYDTGGAPLVSRVDVLSTGVVRMKVAAAGTIPTGREFAFSTVLPI